MTCAPQLLHSFVYKIPTWGRHLLTPVGFMDLIRFACSRDLIIAEVSTLYSDSNIGQISSTFDLQ